MQGFLIIVVLFAAIWLIFLMPAAPQARPQHAAMQDSIEVGDDIISAGGMHGTVREIDDDLVKVEIAPSVVVTLDRRAVAAVATRGRGRGEPETGEADPLNGGETPRQPS